MESNMFYAIKSVLSIIWKIISPPLMFTGLIWVFIPWMITGFVTLGDANPSNTALFPLSWWIVFWLLAAYTFAQNVTRKVKRDPSFKLWKWALGKGMSKAEQKALNPSLKDFYADKPEGLPLGKQKNKWVNIPDTYFAHQLTTGGSGTGKTSSVIIPQILTTKLPCFVVDIKKELAEKTAKPDDLIFDPSDKTSMGYNPFGLVTEENVVLDITTIANALIPISEEKKGDAFWDLEAQSLLGGSLLYLYKKGYNFTDAMRYIQSTPVVQLINEALDDGDPDVKVKLGHFYKMAENTLSGISATVASRTMIFASDKDLQRSFSMPDDKCIKPQDLLAGHNIYLCIPESRLENYKFATGLIIQQWLSFFESQPDDSGGKPRVNFILDEFYRLGHLSSVEKGLATLRSKGVRIHIITQSNAQLEAVYGKIGSKVITDNCNVMCLLGATDVETQEYYSKKIGTYDKTKKSFSDNKGDFKVTGTSGISVSQEEKRLVKPEQLATLGDEAIVFTPKGWGRVKKQPYYCTPEYREN